MYIHYKNADIDLLPINYTDWEVRAVFNYRFPYPVKFCLYRFETVDDVREYCKTSEATDIDKKAESFRRHIYDLCLKKYHELYGRVKPKIL